MDIRRPLSEQKIATCVGKFSYVGNIDFDEDEVFKSKQRKNLSL